MSDSTIYNKINNWWHHRGFRDLTGDPAVEMQPVNNNSTSTGSNYATADEAALGNKPAQSSEPGTCERGVRYWIRNNKKKTGAIVCCFAFFVFLTSLLGFALAIADLTNAKIADVRIEVFPLCSAKSDAVNTNRVKVSAVLMNPCSVPVRVNDFSAQMTLDGAPIMSVPVKGFDVTPNSNVTIEIDSLVTIESEQLAANLISSVLSAEQIEPHLFLEIPATVLGVSLTVPLDVPIPMNKKDPNAKPADPDEPPKEPNLQFRAVSFGRNDLSIAEVNLFFSWTNATLDNFVVHVPPLLVDAQFPNPSGQPLKFATASVSPFSLAPEQDWNANLTFNAANVSAASNLVNNFWTGSTSVLAMSGSASASDSCVLQKILKLASIRIPLPGIQQPNATEAPATTAPPDPNSFNSAPETGSSQLVFHQLNVLGVNSTTASVFAKFELELGDLPVDIYGALPTVTLDIETSYQSAAAVVTASNVQLTGNISLRVDVQAPQPLEVADMINAIMNGESVAVNVTGSNTGATNVLSQILQGLVLPLTFNSDQQSQQRKRQAAAEDEEEVDPVVELKRIEVNSLVNQADITVVLGVNLGNRTDMVGTLPSMVINVDDLTLSQRPLLHALTVTFDVTLSPNEARVRVLVDSANVTTCAELIQKVLNDRNISLLIQGSNTQTNVIGRILSGLSFHLLDLTNLTGRSQVVTLAPTPTTEPAELDLPVDITRSVVLSSNSTHMVVGLDVYVKALRDLDLLRTPVEVRMSTIGIDLFRTAAPNFVDAATPMARVTTDVIFGKPFVYVNVSLSFPDTTETANVIQQFRENINPPSIAVRGSSLFQANMVGRILTAFRYVIEVPAPGPTSAATAASGSLNSDADTGVRVQTVELSDITTEAVIIRTSIALPEALPFNGTLRIPAVVIDAFNFPLAPSILRVSVAASIQPQLVVVEANASFPNPAATARLIEEFVQLTGPKVIQLRGSTVNTNALGNVLRALTFNLTIGATDQRRRGANSMQAQSLDAQLSEWINQKSFEAIDTIKYYADEAFQSLLPEEYPSQLKPFLDGFVRSSRAERQATTVAPNNEPFRLKSIRFVDGDPLPEVAVNFNLNMSNGIALKLKIPPLVIQAGWNNVTNPSSDAGTRPLVAVTLRQIELDSLKFDQTINVAADLLSLRNAQKLLSFYSSSCCGTPAIRIMGLSDGARPDHQLTRVLRQFRYNFPLNKTVAPTTAPTPLGPMPSWYPDPLADLASIVVLPSSNKQNIDLRVDFTIKMTAGTPTVTVGDIAVDVYYENGVIGYITLDNLAFYPGTVQNSIYLSLTTEYAKENIERFVEGLLFLNEKVSLELVLSIYSLEDLWRGPIALSLPLTFGPLDTSKELPECCTAIPTAAPTTPIPELQYYPGNFHVMPPIVPCKPALIDDLRIWPQSWASLVSDAIFKNFGDICDIYFVVDLYLTLPLPDGIDITLTRLYTDLYFNSTPISDLGWLDENIPWLADLIEDLSGSKNFVELGPVDIPGSQLSFDLADIASDNLPVTFRPRKANFIRLPVRISNTEKCLRAVWEALGYNDGLIVQLVNPVLGIKLHTMELNLDFTLRPSPKEECFLKNNQIYVCVDKVLCQPRTCGTAAPGPTPTPHPDSDKSCKDLLAENKIKRDESNANVEYF